MKFHNLIIIALGLAFFEGVAIFVGIPSLEYQLLIDVTVILLFGLALAKNSNRFVTPALGIFLVFSIFFLISGIVNNSEFFTSYRMFRNTLIPFLLFLSVVNLPLEEKSFLKINNFLYLMLFAQIMVSIIKFIVWGVREGGIVGTFSTSAGALSTIFPLLAIIFLMFLYLIYDKKKIYIFLMAGFLFMAWGGGKRAIVFILPVMLVIAFLLYKKMEFNISVFSPINVLKAFPLIVLLIPILYIAVIYTPTLNPERQFGGTFDVEHILDYSSNYHTGEHEIYMPNRFGEQKVLIGRVATTIYAIKLATESQSKFFTGNGPSSIYAASRGDDKLISLGVVEFQTGFGIYLVSVGIPAALLIVLFYLFICIKCFNYYQYFDSYWRALILGIFMCMFVFLFDYFNYSPVFIHGLIPSMVFFYVSGAIINKQKLIKEFYNIK